MQFEVRLQFSFVGTVGAEEADATVFGLSMPSQVRLPLSLNYYCYQC